MFGGGIYGVWNVVSKTFIYIFMICPRYVHIVFMFCMKEKHKKVPTFATI